MANKFVNFVGKLKPAIIMVIVQFIVAMVNIFYKLAVNDGMSVRILIAYRFIFATACVVPFALIFERTNRPKLTWTIVFQGTLCGLFGCSLSQNLMIKSITLTSATFATAMVNLIPALTFILTVLFRLESLEIRKMSGIAKVAGTLVSLSGGMVLIFYKGSEIKI
ncbi:hypothetical protein Patl1_27732 [Pistacia atlantica]|uniref:Uncharacterized protein n=1 Tax=Pistacia atlantica TaxID=434234 RepID=A0ACC1BEN0_9ROSI|nr:hypothetical protein Patl1_27732 [Pistacia atlantica]